MWSEMKRFELSPRDVRPVKSAKSTNGRKPNKKLNLPPMTEKQIMDAALSDPDAQPLTEADFARMRRAPQCKIIRRAFGLTQEQFSEQFGIPLGTLRDWEQGRSEPDQPARTYLKVIARDPDGVRRALSKAAV